MIEQITARQILDSRGMPTLSVTMRSNAHFAEFSVPAGKSTGKREAVELRDGDKGHYDGAGVLMSVMQVDHLKGELIGYKLGRQSDFDHVLRRLDGTPNFSKLGANTVLGLSGAYLKLSALVVGKPLWRYIADLQKTKPSQPRIYANLVNGGKHAPGLDIQEFMLVPRTTNQADATNTLVTAYHQLGLNLASRYGMTAVLVGDEGGYAPAGATHDEIWAGLAQLAKEFDCDLACDAAASSFLLGEAYHFQGQMINSAALSAIYQNWVTLYGILSIEDPFAEDDAAAFAELARKTKAFIVGDDLTVTSAPDIEKYAESGAIGGVIIKPNQIGTFTDTFAAIAAAQSKNIKVIISHRSGETLDDTIADLAVGFGAFGIKIGAPARGERIAKYNRLLTIEEELKEVNHG